MTLIDFSNYPFEHRDLTNQDQNSKVLDLADIIYKNNPDILEIEDDLFRNSGFVSNSNPVLLEAIKCAASKRLLVQNTQSIHLTIVFAMYKETARLLDKSENVHGEDCLREKVRQLKWLEKDISEMFSWNIIAVDDGCPDTPSSYEVASKIVYSEFYDNVEVLKLKSAINNSVICQGFTDLSSTTDSKKGGAITYGLWKAQETFVSVHKHHVVLYTDADLSSNLAQSGHLIHPIVNLNKKAAIAHRYGIEKSVLVKEHQVTTEPESTRLQPGKLIILLRHYARKSLLPQLEGLKDTQAGFKAFDAEALKEVLLYMEFMNETFDVELLLRFITEHGQNNIESVPILFTEDLAMSNFPANHLNNGHLDMFNQIVNIYEKIGFRLCPVNASTVNFWKNLTFNQLDHIIAHFTKQSVNEIDKDLFDFKWDLKNIISFSSSDKK